MKSKNVYLLFCILGAVIPYWQFIRWLAENGLNISLVLISAIVLLRFISAEGSRLHLKQRWLVSLSVVLVGVSLGLPLFLYLRERQLEQGRAL